MATFSFSTFIFIFCLFHTFDRLNGYLLFSSSYTELPINDGSETSDIDQENCPFLEHWNNCFAHCQHNCSNWGLPIPCPDICKPGCVCDDSYIRGPDNKCILPMECKNLNELFEEEDNMEDHMIQAPEEPKCPSKEHWDWCNAGCQKTCSNKGEPGRCPRTCKSGCSCNAGFVRGPSGKCILPRLCPVQEENIAKGPYKCSKNQHWDPCKVHCGKNCSNYDKKVPCPPICISGCVCDTGYIWGPNGDCIRPFQCPPKSIRNLKEREDFCPPNEEFSHCLAHCQRNCSNWSDPTTHCQKICVPGCICKPGMVRGPHGTCIKPRKCPSADRLGDFIIEPECPVEEHYDNCKAHCQRNCSTWNQTLQCSQLCVGGCICDEGFIRSNSGRCIPSVKCSEQNAIASSEVLRQIPWPPADNPECPDVHSCTDWCRRHGYWYGYCTSIFHIQCMCVPYDNPHKRS